MYYNNDTTPIDRSDTDYDTLSDTHNIVVGSIALLLAATTIVVTIVLYRLERHRRPSNDPRNASRDSHVTMNDLGA